MVLLLQRLQFLGDKCADGGTAWDVIYGPVAVGVDQVAVFTLEEVAC